MQMTTIPTNADALRRKLVFIDFSFQAGQDPSQPRSATPTAAFVTLDIEHLELAD
jgi:hypothetical protein